MSYMSKFASRLPLYAFASSSVFLLFALSTTRHSLSSFEHQTITVNMMTSLTSLSSPTLALLAGIIATAIYGLWWSLLPKPILGIPYNKASANRVFGDVSHDLPRKQNQSS